MSGSTCQFCGKPLWRIRRGSDGEFCSREHRNQYKLRMGLSQLAEADKLPGLRRRRDQCNAPALFRAAGHPDVEERRSSPFRTIAGERPAPRWARKLGEPAARVLSAATELARVGRGVTRLSSPHAAAAPPIRSRGALQLRMVLPSRHDSHLLAQFTPVHVPAADGALNRPVFLIARFAPRREAPKRRAHVLPVNMPQSGRLPDSLAIPAGGAKPLPRFAGRPAAEPRTLTPRMSGPSLAVSVDYGSLVPLPHATPMPGPSLRSLREPAPFLAEATSALPALRWLRIGSAGTLATRAKAALAPPCALDRESRRLVARLTGPPAAVGLIAFRRPPAAWTGSIAVKGPHVNLLPGATCRPAAPIVPPAPPPGPRSSPKRHAAWFGATHLPSPGASGVKLCPRGGQLGRVARPSTVPYAGRVASPAVPAPAWTPQVREAAGRDSSPSPHSPIPNGRRAAEARAPKDPFFHPRVLALEGDLADSPQETAPSVLQDEFSSGLGLWSGETSSWKLDFAGVRPGALAFFTPSQGLRDYQLEFLARIERGALTCALRACDADSHWSVRLAAGTLERCAVIGGRAESPVSTALPGIPKGKSLTIRFSVCGNEFTAAINGREVDRWSDGRLPSGGIGFASGPEDRVRLYWIKVSPGSPKTLEQVSQP